jgi:flagellar motility protein MotE (MotC chaperone)
MTRLIRDLRIVPIVLVAVIGLFILKTLGLVLEGGYTLGGRPPESTARQTTESQGGQSWAQQMFNFPSRGGSVPETPDTLPAPIVIAPAPFNASDITGSVPSAPKPAAAPAKAGPANPPPDKSGAVPLGDGRVPSTAERALLERLQERRGELETRAREIEMRENLLKAAEKKLEDRMNELKAVEQRITDATAKKEEAEASRFKNLVTMYENMKAKEAAKIFDRLDIRVLLDMTAQMNPRRMADILAQMSPEAAEKLTVELANKANNADRKPLPVDPATLPKIEGSPTAPGPTAAAAPAR